MPGLNLGLGARDVRLLTDLVTGAAALLPTPVPPANDCLRDVAGAGGGPIDVRVPPALGRDALVTVTDGALELEGVPVRGVDVAESCFVGDLVGDYI